MVFGGGVPVLLLGGWLLAGRAGGIELTFWVEAMGNECFFEDVYKGDKVSGNYQVTSGGNLETNFHIADPTGKMVIVNHNSVEDLFQFEAEESGEFSFCFSNELSRNEMKSVT